MFNVGPEKLMVVLLVALIVLGPDKLPNAARQIGRYLNDFRRISQGFQQELRSAIDMAADPVTTFTQATPGDAGTATQPTTPVDPEPDLDPGAEADAAPMPRRRRTRWRRSRRQRSTTRHRSANRTPIPSPPPNRL